MGSRVALLLHPSMQDRMNENKVVQQHIYFSICIFCSLGPTQTMCVHFIYILEFV